MKIIKVINNNTVCALDKKGKEQIISGKGIGFGKKRGDEVDSAQIQKIYMIADSACGNAWWNVWRKSPTNISV